MTGPLERIHFGSVVTREYLLDLLVLHESLVESWTYYPFTLHAFAIEDDVAQRLAAAGLERLEVHRLPGKPGQWHENAARGIELVEQSGLERCIVTDADNVFLAETPELWLLLDRHDLVFASGAGADRPAQTSVWSFRRTERSLEFARRWRARTLEAGPAGRSTLLGELVAEAQPGESITLLPVPPSPPGEGRPSPYGVDADLPEVSVERDQLGFRESRGGRIKILHLAGLRAQGNRSLADRIDLLIERYPQVAPVLGHYGRLARRAAGRLGLDVVRHPDAFVRDRLIAGGILPTRNQLPAFLNRRGLDGTGVEVGVKKGLFSETLLRSWRGRKLISVDPWAEGPPDDPGDAGTREEHERFYEESVERLSVFGRRSAVWRMTSVEAAAQTEPGSLDFVYLDARHDYASVKEDLEHWFGKIRAGGVFAGHDYMDSPNPDFRVKQAVDEFFAGRGLPVRSTYAEGRAATWLVEIP